MDDGYNSLANTGSTQSNLSSGGRDVIDVPRLNRIRETQSSRSENSEFSPKLSSRSSNSRPAHRHSTHNCSALDSSKNTDASHITCPLQRPDGASDTESHSFDESSIPNLQSSQESTPLRDLTGLSAPSSDNMIAPPNVFADRPAEGKKLTYIKAQDTPMSRSTNSGSYDFDDYIPPHIGCDNSYSTWPAPPLEESILSNS